MPGLKAKSIREKFSNYTEEEIRDALNRLREDQKELIIKAYGPNLDDVSFRNNLDVSIRKKVDSIVHNTFFSCLNNPSKIAFEVKNVFDFFPEYTKEEVLNGFSLLSENTQSRIKRVYGENLEDVKNRRNIDVAELKRIHQIIDVTLRSKIAYKNNSRALNVYEYFSSFSKEEILSAFSTLTYEQQELFKRAYGPNLDDASYRLKLSNGERHRVNDILRSTFTSRVSSTFKRKRTVKNIFEHYSHYNKDEILDAFSRLSEDQQKILIKAYGENLDRRDLYGILDEFEKKRVNGIVSHELLTRLMKKDKLSVQTKTIFEIYNKYSREDVLDAIYRLKDDDIKLLKLAFGDNFDDASLRLELSRDKKARINCIIFSSLVRRLQNPKLNSQIIFTIFDEYSSYTDEEILSAFNSLNDNQKKLLKRAYGEDLRDAKKIESLTTEERQRVKKIVRLSINSKLNPKKIIRSVKNVYERYPNYSKDEVLDAVSRLDDYSRKLLYKAYGEDLSRKDLYSLISDKEKIKIKNIIQCSLECRLRDRVSIEEEKKDKYSSLPLAYEKYSWNEVINVISNLEEEEKKLLTTYYGDDFKQEFDYSSLNEDEKKNLNVLLKHRVIDNLRLNRVRRERLKTIFDFFGNDYTDEEILNAFSKLNDDDQKILKDAFGEDLRSIDVYYHYSKKEKTKVRRIMTNRLKKILETGNANYKHTSNFYERLANYSKEEIDDAFMRLSSEKQKFLYSAFGDDLLSTSGYLALSSEDKGKISTLIHKDIVNRIKNPTLSSNTKGRLVKSIVERFPDKSYDDIMYHFNCLTLEQQKILIKAFGENLDLKDRFAYLTEEEKEFCFKAISSLRFRLTTTKTERIFKVLNFFERYPSCTEEQLMNIFLSFSDSDKELLYMAFGEDLKSKVLFHHLSFQEKNRVNYVLLKVRKIVKNNSVIEDNQDVLEKTLSFNKTHITSKEKTLIEEKNIKRSRLSYYYISSIKEREKILDDYCSVVSRFKKVIDVSSDKDKIIASEVESSILFKESFFEKKEYLLKRIASKYIYYNISQDDIMNIGYNGLDIALRYYDNINNQFFDEYAEEYIKNEIETYLKKNDIKVKKNIDTVKSENLISHGFQGRIPLSLKDFISSATTEKIMDAVSYLPVEQQELLKSAYGDNLDDISQFSVLSETDKTRVYRIRRLLKDYLDGKITKEDVAQSNSFKTYIAGSGLSNIINEFGKEEFLNVVDLLIVSDQELLKKAYGDDYNDASGYKLLTKNEKNKVYKIRRKIYDYLTGKKKIVEKSKGSENNYFGKVPKDLISFFGDYDAQDVINSVSYLSEANQQLLIKAYGNKFDDISGFYKLERSEKIKINTIRSRLKIILSNENLKGVRNIPLKQFLGNVSLEQINEMMEQISQSKRDIFIKVYGEDYSSYNGCQGLSNYERIKLYETRSLMKKIVDKEEDISILNNNNSTVKSLIETFETYDTKLVYDAIDLLTIQEKDFLKQIYGDNYNEVLNYDKLDNNAQKKLSRLRVKIRNHLTGKKLIQTRVNLNQCKVPKDLFSFFTDYSREDVLQSISYLSDDYKQLLIKAYGSNYDEISGFNTLTDKEKNLLCRVRNSIKNYLIKGNKKTQTAETLKHYLGDISIEKINELINFLPEEKKELLIKVYGEDFDSFNGFQGLKKSEINKIYQIRSMIRNVINGKADISVLKINTYKSKPLFEYFRGYDYDLINKVIEKLTDEEIELLKKGYGKDYKNTNLYVLLSDDDKDKIIFIRKKIRLYLNEETKLDNNTERLDIVYKKAKSIKEYFSDYSDDQLMSIINNLPYNQLKLLKKAYGSNLDDSTNYYNLTIKEKNSVASIRYKIKRILKKDNVDSSRENNYDYLFDDDDDDEIIIQKNRRIEEKNSIYNLKYKPLSRRDEIIFIKKAKLSFFDEVDEDLQKKYLDYYFEVFPNKGKRYTKVLDEIRNIENSIDINQSNVEELKILSQKLKRMNDKRHRLLESYIMDSKRYRDRFLENNQRLIMSIAVKWRSYSLEELLMEGNIGMMRALLKFDVDQGNKFSTYATWWIKQSITRYIADYENTIRIPVHQGEKLKKLNKVYDELYKKLLRKPTDEELSLATGYSLDLIEDLRIYKSNFLTTTSLDQNIDDSENSFSYFIGVLDESYESVEDSIFSEEIRRFITQANLTDREKKVLIRRFGLDGKPPGTLNDIGEHNNLSRERVRQIEEVALNKLKVLSRTSSFFDYLNDSNNN